MRLNPRLGEEVRENVDVVAPDGFAERAVAVADVVKELGAEGRVVLGLGEEVLDEWHAGCAGGDR